VKAAGGDAHDAGDGHGDVGAELHVAGRHAGLDEGVLEGEATAEEERDQIVPPHVADVGALLGQLASPVDAVAGHVGTEVGPGGRTQRLRITRDGDLDDGARLGVARAEGGELGGHVPGKDHRVDLLVG
jgi:hypothetical protein